MPTSNELVANRPLAGSDLLKIIMEDVQRMLDGDAFLTGHVAYHRIAYELRLTLHMDNFSYPKSVTPVRSRPRSETERDDKPELAAIESGPPLVAPSKSAYLTSTELTRDIPSPNLARIEHGIPVTIMRRDPNTGGMVEENIKYPSEIGESEFVPPTITDVSEAVRAELQQPIEQSEPINPDTERAAANSVYDRVHGVK